MTRRFRLAARVFFLLAITMAAPLSLTGSSTPAWATTFYEQPFPDGVKGAPIIARGRIGTTYSDWGRSSDGSKRIYTFYELRVEEVFKGPAGSASGILLMREMGGEKDGIGMQVSGSAQFTPGEDVVVFLGERNAEGSYDVWGMMMGKFNVQKDVNGTEFLSGPGINDLAQPRIGDGEGGQHGAQTPKKWTLGDLRRLIASQGDAALAHPTSPQNRVVAPTPSLSPGVAVVPSPAASLAAPHLQNSSPDEVSQSAGTGLAIGAGVLGLAMVLISRWRR